MKKYIATVAFLSLGAVSHATEVYGGIGSSGLQLGMSYTLNPSVVVRGDFMGGLSLSTSKQRDGVNYDSQFKSNRLGGFVDWFPFSNRSAASGFRVTGGLTLNSIKMGLNANATSNASATVNGKTVNLSGETLNVDLKFPTVTPYIGIGYGHQASNSYDRGLGFHVDVGMMIGRFNTAVTTSLVGKQGITQADIDAAAKTVRDSVSKISILPSASIGASYRF
jgi:hypothetical protein